MFGKLKSLFGGTDAKPRMHVAPEPTTETLIAPEHIFAAVGDVHGCLPQLETLYGKLKSEFGSDLPVIFLGDIVDRGPDTAGALRMIYELCRDAPESHGAIMGNHEEMMLEFIDDPVGKGSRWLVFGGQQTLASFGISIPSTRPDVEEAMEVAEALEDAMPQGMLAWLRGLPTHWSTGNIHCVHAGMNPGLAPGDQTDRVMINGHPAFLTTPRHDGQTVLHGHTVMNKATIGDGRISIDTGAYMTGVLTAAHVAPGTCRFLSTGS